jgi:AraC-like DNA-binding protein
VITLADLIPLPPWTSVPNIEFGGGGPATRIVCGYLQSDDPLFDPRLAVFPEAFVVHPDAAAATWVSASVEYVMTQAGDATSLTGLVPTRIPEFLVVEVLRLHLASAPWSDSRWLAALSDSVVGPVLAVMHADPGRKWTVAELASEVAVSRSLLDERFRDVVGQAPISYLARWRMHVAADLLAGTQLTIGSVGRRVGYEAEEAFSRAFKKTYGTSPGAWRQRG